MGKDSPSLRQDKRSDDKPTAYTHKEKMIVLELLQRLYNKAQPVIQKHTGYEFNAVHHKDIDYEYWKITGETMR